MTELIQLFTPVAIALLLLGILLIVYNMYFELNADRVLLATCVQHLSLQRQEFQDRLAGQDKLKHDIELLRSTQSEILNRVHKISIHYAPYLRTRNDIRDEADYAEAVYYHADIDSQMKNRNESKGTYELNPRDPIEGQMIPGQK